MRYTSIIFLFFLSTQGFSQRYDNQYIKETSLENNWRLQNEGDTSWIRDVKFPANIHQILFEKKLIPDPYYGDNEKRLNWIEEADWVAENEFNIYDDGLPEKFLVVEKPEAHVAIYINNYPVLLTENSFTDVVRVNITNYINKNKQNTIRILFPSQIDIAKKLKKADSLNLPVDERVYIRKPQYEFGWDWGPRFVTTGIKGQISIISAPKEYFEIRSHYSRTSGMNSTEGEIETIFEIYSTKDQTIYTNYHSYNTKYLAKKIKLKKGDNKIILPITIKNPQLWWPGHMGSHPSYQIAFAFSHKKLKANKQLKAIYTTTTHIFCTIELVQEKDSIGKSFHFMVNGIPTYAKGFNIIPEDHLALRYKYNAAEASRLVDNLSLTGSNTVRVWGGGTYLPDSFYEKCIEYGIMVWQDFMFACAMYPGDAGFLKNIKNEVKQQVVRLRRYNNIALWCGNNESDEAWKNWGWQNEFGYSIKDSTKIWDNYVNLFQKEIPTLLKEYWPEQNYVSTSPQIGWGHKESMTHGDSHYWGVWWGKEPIKTFEKKIPRFMSEFGMQAMPDMTTLEKVIPDSAMHFNSQKFKNHQKHPTGFQTLNHYLKEELVVPKAMDDYAFATQILQSYTLKTAIEAQRRSKPRCMGTLIWQLNDSWPVTSWSVVDYYNHKKLAFNQVANSFNGLLLSVEEETNGYSIFIVNDNIHGLTDDLELYVSDFAGNKVWEKKLNVSIKPNSSETYFFIEKNELKGLDLQTVFLHLKLSNNGANNNFHFVKLNQLKLPKIKCKISIEDQVTDKGLQSDPHPFYEYRLEIKFDTYSPYFKADESFLFPIKNYDYSNFPAYFPNVIMPGQTITLTVSRDLFLRKEDIEQTILESFKSLNSLLIDNK
jgi:beta-mannosidase